MGYILWILFITIFFGANPPSEAFIKFLVIYTVAVIVLIIIAAWKEGDRK